MHLGFLKYVRSRNIAHTSWFARPCFLFLLLKCKERRRKKWIMRTQQIWSTETCVWHGRAYILPRTSEELNLKHWNWKCYNSFRRNCQHCRTQKNAFGVGFRLGMAGSSIAIPDRPSKKDNVISCFFLFTRLLPPLHFGGGSRYEKSITRLMGTSQRDKE